MESRNAQTGEDVWHLPGKIPISQIRALRELQRSNDGGALFARSMVRVGKTVALWAHPSRCRRVRVAPSRCSRPSRG